MSWSEYIKNPQKFWEDVSKEEMVEKCKEVRADFEKEGKKRKVTYVVEDVRGVCPLYKAGDIALVIESEGSNDFINTDLCANGKTCYGLLDNLHFRQGWQHLPREHFDHLQVTTGECKTYCAHPGPPYSPCGGVIFRIFRDDEWEE